MGKNTYKAFGLNIVSDFKLPELIEGNGKNDVELLHGVIDEINDDLSNDRIFTANPEEITYQLKNIARCKILNGKTAIIMPSPSSSNSTLRLLILTSVFGCILIQRKMIPIHGSSIAIGNKSIIIIGSSGAGKSTLASTFIKEGYKFLSDDISVVSINECGEMCVQPGYPYRKLHQDSAEYHSLNLMDFEKIEFEDDKYLIPQQDSFMDKPLNLGAFIEIVPEDVDTVSIEKIRGMSKLDVFMRNIYRGKLTGYFNSKPYYFERIGYIASKVDVFRIIRPKNMFTCNDQVKLILKELGASGGVKR